MIVLMHWREQKLITNTATLASLALPNSEIHLRGQKGNPLEVEALIPPGSSPALLYPTEDALELNEGVAQSLPRPLTLIVPDGSWRQARKVSFREKAFKDIPKLKLPPGPPSTYRLRHSLFAENLSTFEAIARALGVLEGKNIQERLEELFLTMVERILWSRGSLNSKDCVTEIPPEAFLASYYAGIEGGKKGKARE